MDSLGLSSTVKKREVERNRLRLMQKQRIEDESRKSSEAVSKTAALLAERAAIRRDEEVKSLLRQAQDKGADDGGVSFEVTLNALVSEILPADSDRIILPQSVLQELSAHPSVRYPLMFEFFNCSNGLRTHGGVLEFCSDPGIITIPQKVQRCLGLDGGSKSVIRVRYKQLERCKYLRCSVPADSIAIFPDIRAFIESSLRLNHVTITEGDRLIVGNVVPMIVDKLEPDFACCLIDTDVELDLCVSNESINETGTKWSVGGSATFDPSSPSQVLGLSGKFKITPSDIVVIRCDNISDPSLDMFVSIPPLLDAHIGCFDFVAPFLDESDVREIRINLGHLVTARPGLTDWPVFVTVGIPNLKKHVQVRAHFEQEAPSDISSVSCDNCDQKVSIQALELHQLHCQSRIRRCATCQKPIRISELDQHKHCDICGHAYSYFEAHAARYHSLVKCLCGDEVVRYALEEHRATTCPNRLVGCQFCGILTPVGNTASMDARDRMMGFKSEHEALCGNRTDRCSICGRLERLKDMEFHRQAFHPD